MKPKNCSFCKGTLHEGTTEFVVKVKNEVVSISNVPAYICQNCGESFFNPQVSRRIDDIMKEFHEGKLLAHPIAAGEVEFDMAMS